MKSMSISVKPLESNDVYEVLNLSNHEEWLNERGNGIGGSDVSALVGCNPYKTLQDLWREKKNKEKVEITNDAIVYGQLAEEGLRILYCAKHPSDLVYHDENVILVNKEHEWMRYSPDGLIVTEDGKKGILEIKTANVNQYHKWFGHNKEPLIPDNYLAQTLHGLLVTGFDFVRYIAEIRFEDNSMIIEREYNREDAKTDLEWLMKKEQDAWNKYFVADVEPPLIINI